jgi:stage V sporulation protein B
VRRTAESALRITMLIAAPAGFGMAVLANQIFRIIYPPSVWPIAGPILRWYALFMFLFALSTPVTSVLQGMGRMDIPLKSLAVGTVAKVVLNYVLVGRPSLNINGAVFGSIACYVIVVGINLGALLRVSKIRLRWLSVFGKPLFCGGLCGAGAWAMQGLAGKLLAGVALAGKPDLLPTALAVLFGGLIYVLALLFSCAVTRDDVDMLPGGKKVGKVLAKYGLLG